jgi:hypothetical protein
VKILHSTHTRPIYIPPPILASDQVVCGPRFPDMQDGSRVVSMTSPEGDYDIAEVLNRLPVDQHPDLLVVRTDSKRENQPRNLSAVKGRKVLMVGDTHHQVEPIRAMLDYAMAEPFDRIVFDFTRQHAHFFIEAGLKNVHWLPGYNVMRIPFDADAAPEEKLSLIAKMDKRYHSRRIAFCNEIVKANLPIVTGEAPLDKARARHARSIINVNCSLNGDLNLRVLEVMIAGGFLLTDRLSPQAGLDLLFKDGEHYVSYGSIPEGVERCKELLEDRDRTRRIAAAGKAAYEEKLAPEKMVAAFFDLLEDRPIRAEFDLKLDRRATAGGGPEHGGLRRRIRLYEIVQEIHRVREFSNVLIGPSVDRRLISDLADLPRLRCCMDGTGDRRVLKQALDYLDAVDVLEGIRVQSKPDDFRTVPWRIVAATQADLRGIGLCAALDVSSKPYLLLTDLDDGVRPSARTNEFLEQRGFKPQGDGSPLYGR